MVFRKWLPVLAVLALLLGMTVSANAQCIVTSGGTPTVRAEGLTELVGDVSINCTGQVPVTGVSNIQVFLNTNITSKILGTSPTTTTEALLLVDNLDATATNPAGAAVVAPATAPAVANVFVSQKVSDNSIAFFNVPVPGPGSTRNYRITNVRANANQVGVSASLIPNQIVMFISTSGSQPLPIAQAQVTVAFVQSGMAFARRNCGDTDSASTTFPQCSSQNKDLASDQTKTGQKINFTLRYTETFGAAFKVLGVSTAIDPATGGLTFTNQTNPAAVVQNVIGGGGPTSRYSNSESGFTPTNAAGSLVLPGAGQATQGTRLLARFNNIPAGVQIFVTTFPAVDAQVKAGFSTFTVASNLASGVATGLNAVLVSTSDPSGASGSAGFPITGTGTAKCTSDTTQPIAPVTLAGGNGAATWEITDSNPSAIESVAFGVTIAYRANTASNSPAIGTGTVVGSFGPVSSVITSSGSAPIPRFADAGTSGTAVNITACFTNILFPFVTNQGGFDTGVAIANTSQDIFDTTAQTGTCTLNYFGSTAGGGAAPSAQTSAAVPAGSQLIFTLSTGGNLGITSTPGFQGYIIANCKFQLAHGFAFISDVGAQKLAQGYLGLILTNGSDTRSGTENLNN